MAFSFIRFKEPLNSCLIEFLTFCSSELSAYWLWFLVEALCTSLWGIIKFHTSKFQFEICLAHSQVSRHRKIFYLCFFFQHHIHEQIFNTFSTNLHLNLFQFNLNPIIEFIFNSSGIHFKSIQKSINTFEFNPIQGACKLSFNVFIWMELNLGFKI